MTQAFNPSRPQSHQVHQLGRLAIGFLDPLHDALGVGRVFQLDGNYAVDLEFLDGLEIRRELHDAPARRQVAVYVAVAIAEVDMDGLALELAQVGGARVGEHEMADVDVGPDARMIALVHETHHLVDVVEQAQAERFQFEREVDVASVGIIPQRAARLQAPLPLRLGRDDFALPNVFAEDEQNIPRAPSLGQVDEPPAALDVERAHRVIEIDQTHGHHRQRDDRQPQLLRGPGDQADFLFREADGLREDVHRVETDARNVFQAGGRVEADLVERTVDEAKFHGGFCVVLSSFGGQRIANHGRRDNPQLRTVPFASSG